MLKKTCLSELRSCSRCSAQKPLEDFVKKKNTTDGSGRGAHCKKCHSESVAAYWKRPDVAKRKRKYSAERYFADPEGHIDKSLTRYYAKRAKLIESRKHQNCDHCKHWAIE